MVRRRRYDTGAQWLGTQPAPSPRPPVQAGLAPVPAHDEHAEGRLMATGSGYCPHCGNAVLPGQPFCGKCGQPLAAPQPQAVAPQPQAAPPPPALPVAPPPPALPVAPQAPVWSAPPQAPQPAPQQAPQQQAWPGYAIPQAPARARVNPALIVVGALVVVALIAAVGFVALNSNSGSGPVPGNYTLDPAALNCASPGAVIVKVTLPATVQGSEMVTSRLDGSDWGRAVKVSDFFQQQSDGTWTHEDAPPDLGACKGPSGALTQGTHKLQVVDSKGKVLAEVSFTVTG